jgi:hypothetical protein
MRQNIAKLVKIKGGNAASKADMFFVKAKEREDIYENQFKSDREKPSGTTPSQVSPAPEGEGMISTVLKSIVSGIAGLGSAIVSAFATMGNFIKKVLTSIASSILKTVIKGFGGVMVKALSTLLKQLGLSTLIWKLIRFALRPQVLIPMILAATAYATTEYLKENPFEFLRDSEIAGQVQALPIPNLPAGTDLGGGMTTGAEYKGHAGRGQVFPTQDDSRANRITRSNSRQSFTPEVFSELEQGKRKFYPNIIFPGKARIGLNMPMTDAEAQSLGKGYLLLDSLIKQRKKLIESEAKPETVFTHDRAIFEHMQRLRKEYFDLATKVYKPGALNQDFIQLMEQSIKNPELGPIERRIYGAFDDAMKGVSDADLQGIVGNLDFSDAERILNEELKSVPMPTLEPPVVPDSGAVIDNKTSDVKVSRMDAFRAQPEVQIAGLSSGTSTSSVSHVGGAASPWNSDLIENYLNNKSSLIGIG